MAITIDYIDPVQYVIQIPRADMLDVTAGGPTEIRQLNIDQFRRQLDDLMDDGVGIAFQTTHFHTPPLTVAGVTLARVVEILSPYVIEFEDGLYNVNIVGGNSNISDVTVKNQVGVNTANSAGLQDPFALQMAAFGGVVSWNPNALTTGTTFPFGTRSFPANNLVDVLVIAEQRGIRDILCLANGTLSGGDFSDGYNFIGDNANVLLTLEDLADTSGCEFKNLTIRGALDGSNTLRECAIMDLDYFNGFIFQCGFIGPISLLGTTTAVILQSFSLSAENGLPSEYPTVDLGGNDGTQRTPLVIRDWVGALSLANCDAQAPGVHTSIDMSSGVFHASDTVLAGGHTVRGIVSEIMDESGPGASILDHTLTTALADMNIQIERTRRHLTNRLETDPTTGVATLYEDDGTTPAETSDMFEDVAGSQPYRGQGAERRDGFS